MRSSRGSRLRAMSRRRPTPQWKSKPCVEREAEVDALRRSCGFWRRRKPGQALLRVNCFGRRKRSEGLMLRPNAGFGHAGGRRNPGSKPQASVSGTEKGNSKREGGFGQISGGAVMSKVGTRTDRDIESRETNDRDSTGLAGSYCFGSRSSARRLVAKGLFR